MTLIKTRLTIKLLLLVSVSLSLSQQDGIERKRPKSIVKKPVSIKEIIRYGERGSNALGEVHQKNRSFVSNPFLPMKVSTDTSLRKTKMLSLNKEADNNTGRAIVCGPEGAKFNITWKPKIIDPEKFVQIHLNITAPINLTEGRAHIDVYLEGSPDRLFSMDQEIACDDFSKKIPFLECPVKEGHNLTLPLLFDQLQALPVGSFTIVLNVCSYLQNSQVLFACLNATLEIKPSTVMFKTP
ncbi:uncharacterized protein LOC128190371 [Crassostrea angulata]|uniref:uncharacterized protein LOC128190371 n=1 Tax=Magallana angulata TaxID=2784310 RepID=UPI0022B1541F|nr:uncharacterized protein LOC128190371 [Crassostrea angulata]